MTLAQVMPARAGCMSFAADGTGGLVSGVRPTRLPGGQRPLELRVDVRQRPEALEEELEVLFKRMLRNGDPLSGLPALDIRHPGFAFRHREADGEHYVYAQDLVRGRLAGFTIFNRLVELDRRTERHLRAPHSKFASAYQRRGLASAVYRWWLDGGRCLINGARQSSGAHALWRSLARDYRLLCVEVEEKTLRYLGDDPDRHIKDDLHTRLVLAGAGCRLGQEEGRLTFHPAKTLASALDCGRGCQTKETMKGDYERRL